MQTNDTVLSIITVCYNAGCGIEKTIKSIVPFINENVEYIIIDGESTDETLKIICNYQDFISTCISEPDYGIYDAMNKGVKYATGRWVLFVNNGDQLLSVPSALFNELNLSYDAIACSVLSEHDRVLRPSYDNRILIHNTLPHQGLFYNKLKISLFFDTSYRIYSDYDYNLYMYRNKKKVLILNELVSFHSLFGISNDKTNAKELFTIISNRNGHICVLLSKIYFYISGLKFKLWKCLKID